ncbi:MAG: flagellar biosynthetic protein FliO [Lachnospiraceae bacterium]|nr:flagellar biosynthetic protein FliO [Lachnospiraceae bacterium]
MLLAVASKVDSVVQFFTVLIIFIFVLGATWLTSRYIAGFQKGKMRGNNFEMIDSFRISQNNVVQILRIGQRYVAVAVCKDNVTLLAELSEDEIVIPEGVAEPVQFDEMLKKAKSLIQKTDMKAADKDEEDHS